jgi:hypothetical protein
LKKPSGRSCGFGVKSNFAAQHIRNAWLVFDDAWHACASAHQRRRFFDEIVSVSDPRMALRQTLLECPFRSVLPARRMADAP